MVDSGAANTLVTLLSVQRSWRRSTTRSIHHCSSTTRAVARQPLPGAANTDPRQSSQGGEAFTLINASTQQQFTAEGCQPSIRVGMQGM